MQKQSSCCSRSNIWWLEFLIISPCLLDHLYIIFGSWHLVAGVLYMYAWARDSRSVRSCFHRYRVYVCSTYSMQYVRSQAVCCGQESKHCSWWWGCMILIGRSTNCKLIMHMHAGELVACLICPSVPAYVLCLRESLAGGGEKLTPKNKFTPTMLISSSSRREKFLGCSQCSSLAERVRTALEIRFGYKHSYFKARKKLIIAIKIAT
jgi:hypothetical protein